MTNEEYIAAHLDDDVSRLALAPMPEGVDARWCLQQIEGRQLAKRKLPLWAQIEGLFYPPRLSMEQCSSQATALYKRQLVERLLPAAAERVSMADLTGGFGVDFSYLASLFTHSYYFEQQPDLCRIVTHNLPLLGIPHAEVINADSASDGAWLFRRYSLLFLDPARRDGVGRKTVAIEHCVPDVSAMQSDLLAYSSLVLLKLSPMLDIHMALRRLNHVNEVHVVSVRGECRELLLVLSAVDSPLHIFCVNLDTDDVSVSCLAHEAWTTQPKYLDEMGAFLYEPNASLLKADVQDAVAARCGLLKLHPSSNLFTSTQLCPTFPGRIFRIIEWGGFGKSDIHRLLSGVQQANITVRNFPASVAELRKRLKLREGGDLYLFATTAVDGSHLLIKCRKVAKNSDNTTLIVN